MEGSSGGRSGQPGEDRRVEEEQPQHPPRQPSREPAQSSTEPPVAKPDTPKNWPALRRAAARTVFGAGEIQRPDVRGSRFVPVAQTHTSVAQILISTTEDRARLALEREFRKAGDRQAWLAPGGILLTLVITLVTSEQFQDRLGLSKHTWEAIFVVAAVVVGIWLVRAAVRAWTAPTQEEMIDNVLDSLKQGP
jgi:hypothetical protein